MDSIYYSPCRMNNKHLNQQIQKKFKNRHKNKKQIRYKYATKRTKATKRMPRIHNFSCNKNKRFSKQIKQQCIELKYKSSNIFTINEYINPNPNAEPPHIIAHNNYYNLKQLLIYTKNKRKRKKRNNINQNSNTKSINNKYKYELYNEKYLLSNNDCKWIKLKQGKFFNSSFYIFNNDNAIHASEIVKREENQNIRCVTYFIQNIVEQIYPHSNIILSQDIACVIGEFCRGYLTAQCYNSKCNKYINFFIEDRYNGIHTYFYLSHNFEANNIMYCSDCFMDPKICVLNKCECGETDINSQFNKCFCYKYNGDDAPIIIDEFKCECNTHKLKCSRHSKCKKCKLSPCNECELFGWAINTNGLCIKCSNDCKTIECDGCSHCFDENKIHKCVLCAANYCNAVKWKHELSNVNINKTEVVNTYETYLSEYKCECNWKEKYFDAAHNLWYPKYSKCERRIELTTTNNNCVIDTKIKCVYCNELFAVCNACDVSKHINNCNNKYIICNECILHNTKQCNLCNKELINLNTCDDFNINNIINNTRLSLNDMTKRECIQCDEICYICCQCYDGNYGEYFGLYLCFKCKTKNKRECIYCNQSYFNHILWDKIMGNKTDKFGYFMRNMQCKNKKCNYDIKDMCNTCYAIHKGKCLQCLNNGICVRCNHKIINSDCIYQSLCNLCFTGNPFLLKQNNCFKSNLIDKKWKYNHSQKKLKRRRSKLNKDGKFIYNIAYNGNNNDFGAIKICSKWKKYKKSRNCNKRRF